MVDALSKQENLSERLIFNTAAVLQQDQKFPALTRLDYN